MIERPWSAKVRDPVVLAGLVPLAASVALALRAQALLTPQNLLLGGLIYAVAALLAALSIAVIDRHVPARSGAALPELAETSGTARRRPLVFALLLAAAAATASCAAVLATSGNQSVATLLWLAGLAASTIGLLAAAPVAPPRRPAFDRARLAEIAVVGAILAVGALMRFPDLTHIPPEVHGDEAACGLEARKILHGEMPAIFGFGWYDVPNPSFAISAASMAIFGDDLFGFRTASVLQGLASILLLYAIAKRLFSARTAALAAFFLAVSHWHIHFSRSGIHYMQATFVTTLLVYLLLLALERARPVYFLLTGFAAGLSATVYYAARLAPLLAIWIIGYHLVRDPARRRSYGKGALAFLFGTVLFLLPFAVPAARNPKAVLSRGEGVFVLASGNLQHAKAVYRVESTAGVLGMQVVETIAAFNARGDKSGQHNHPAPLIDFYTGALFVLGVAAAAWRLRDPSYFLLDSWLWATLLTGAVLTSDPVFSPRLSGVLPALFIFPALVVDAGWRATERSFGRTAGALFAVPVALLLLLATRANYHDYFELHIKKLQTSNFYTVLAHYLESVNDRYRIYLLGKRDSSIRQYTIRFLVPDADGVDVPAASLALPLDRIPAEKGIAFVVDAESEGAKEHLEAIRAAYPDGITDEHADEKGFLLFRSHMVDRAALLAASPRATVDSVDSPEPAPPSEAAPAEPVAEPPAVARQQARRSWSWLPEMGELRGVAVSRSGAVYALDRASGSLLRLGSNGEVIRSTALGRGDEAEAADFRAIAIAADDRILLLDSAHRAIRALDADGRQVGTIRLPGGYFPSGLTVDQAGNLVVADTGLSRIVRVAPDETGFAEIGKTGEAGRTLDQPTGVAVGPDGEIFAADIGHARVAVFGPDLAFRRQWTIPSSGTLLGAQLAIGADGVFVSDPDHGRVLQFDLEGRPLAERGAGELQQPVGLALDGKGNLYVADVEARAIFRYATSAAAGPAATRTAP